MTDNDASLIRSVVSTEMRRFVDQVDARFDRVDDRLDRADDKHEEEKRSSSESRRRTYEKIETVERGQTDLRVAVADLTGRMRAVESQLTTNQTTLEEYRSWQEQIRGVSKLGRGMWFIGAMLSGIIAFVIVNWEKLRHLAAGR